MKISDEDLYDTLQDASVPCDKFNLKLIRPNRKLIASKRTVLGRFGTSLKIRYRTLCARLYRNRLGICNFYRKRGSCNICVAWDRTGHKQCSDELKAGISNFHFLIHGSKKSRPLFFLKVK